jgi:two-component system chemotaxis response regulator CheV
MSAEKDIEFKRSFEEMKLVVFNLPNDSVGTRYGINAQKIREVIEFDSIQKLPETYFPYIGIMNLRGVPIPVMDVFSVLNTKADGAKVNQEGNRIIVCETLGKLVGIVSSSSIKMLEFEDKDFNNADFGNSNVKMEYISGIVDHPDGYIFMMNLESVLMNLDQSEKESATNDSFKDDISGKSILVVDDSELFLKKIGRVIRSCDGIVVEAKNGIEGLESLKRSKNIDLIVTDIEMPLMNGIEMARKVKENFSEIPIIFNSSISNNDFIGQVKQENLGDYIVKYSPDGLLEKIVKNLKK